MKVSIIKTRPYGDRLQLSFTCKFQLGEEMFRASKVTMSRVNSPEIESIIKEGRQAVMADCRNALKKFIRRGQEARALLKAQKGAKLEQKVVETNEGEGICINCDQVFELHFVAGIHDRCIRCIPQSYI